MSMIDKKHEEIQAFVGCLLTAIDEGLTHFNAKKIDTNGLRVGLNGAWEATGVAPNTGMPALRHLPLAIGNARLGPIVIRSLAESFQKIVDENQTMEIVDMTGC